MTAQNHKNRQRKSAMSLPARIAGFVICLGLLGVILYYMWREYNLSQPVYQEPVPEMAEEPREMPEETVPQEEPEPGAYYPVGELIDTPERMAYADGDIVLAVPSMGFEGPVLNGVTDEVLAGGVGLFDQAQLPGPMDRNSNVSIAGHRDVHGQEFYHIDKVEVGDEITLTYQGNTYYYIVEESFVTDSMDWEPIMVREYPCVTLQSCTPIGTAVDRIFVVGRLERIVSGMEEDSGDAAAQGNPAEVELPDGRTLPLDTDAPERI